MDALIDEIRQELQLRLLDENIPRIIKCISLLDENQLWWSPNNEIPSIGNLILHLNGNVRQWFLAGFCGLSFVRVREKEFSARKTRTKSELLDILKVLHTDIQGNIHRIDYKLLISKKSIQDHFFVSGFSIISHVIEHFSYHTGQIATLTKILANQDLGFYEDLDL